jgi:hypothetical protein
MARGSFIPEQGERALLVGQTGSGKTAFAIFLVEHIPTAPIILYDTKGEPKFTKLPNSRVVSTQHECTEAVEDPSVDYVIFLPPAEIQGEPAKLDEFLWFHYQHYHGIVAYIDEARTFHRGYTAGRGLIAIMARGRSRGITCILSTQRPSRISRDLISEAQKLYVFRLADLQDRKRLDDVIPNFSKEPLPPKHGFYFFQSGDESPQLFEPIKLADQYNTGYVDASPEPEAGGEIEPASKHLWI